MVNPLSDLKNGFRVPSEFPSCTSLIKPLVSSNKKKTATSSILNRLTVNIRRKSKISDVFRLDGQLIDAIDSYSEEILELVKKLTKENIQ